MCSNALVVNTKNAHPGVMDGSRALANSGSLIPLGRDYPIGKGVDNGKQKLLLLGTQEPQKVPDFDLNGILLRIALAWALAPSDYLIP